LAKVIGRVALNNPANPLGQNIGQNRKGGNKPAAYEKSNRSFLNRK